MNLTDSEFWDDFWASVTLPAVIDPNLSYERCLSDTFMRHLAPDPALQLFEVGCTPGRWLIWFAQTLGYQVSGCDLAPRGVSKTRENLALSGVQAEVCEGDFLTLQLPERAFDVVLSLGVIEHFDDPGPMLARHVRLLRPGGLLVLEVPNFTGLNYRLMRAARQGDLLEHHNLRIMNCPYFRRVAATFGLETRFLGYVGGFEPALFEMRGRPAWVKVIHKLLRTLRSLPGADHVNSPLFSAFLVGIFQVPG